MKTLPVPTRSIRRMKTVLFTKTKSYRMASSVGPPYELELDDAVIAVLYKACDNSDTVVGAWSWEGDEWNAEGIDDLSAVEDRIRPAKPVKKVKKTPEVVADEPKLTQVVESKLSQTEWTPAQRDKFEERKQAVTNAAKKVLK
jgi:hypothetical protein